MAQGDRGSWLKSGLIASRSRQSVAATNVRFGSKADIDGLPLDVRFTPESGHWNSVAKCPLCAKSGHWAAQQLTELFDQLVGEGEQTRRDGETKCLCGRQVDS